MSKKHSHYLTKLNISRNSVSWMFENVFILMATMMDDVVILIATMVTDDLVTLVK